MPQISDALLFRSKSGVGSRLQLDAEDLRAKVGRGGDETERVVVVLVEAERADLMRVII